MSEGTTSVEGAAQEARENLQGLLASLRKARTMRILWTLIAFAIVGVYVLLFFRLGQKAFDPEELGRQVQQKMADPIFTMPFKQALIEVAEDVYPIYRDEVRDKFDELGMTDKLEDKLGEVAKELWPKYRTAFTGMLEEAELMPDLQEEVIKLVREIVPAYRKEMNRIAPEVFEAVTAMQDEALLDLEKLLEAHTTSALQKSLARNQQFILDETGLDEAAFREKITFVVLSVERALVKVVKKRTDRYEADLKEINTLLAQIPETSDKDPDWLVDEIGRVSIQLLKLNIEDYDSQLEW